MQTINPLVVSVSPATGTTPIYPTQLIEHGGGVKKVIGVAAMVLIPVAAPAIASSIAASGVLGASISGAMATTAGAAISSAIVGAGLGAITAKVTGTSVQAGAIGGLLGGGFGGYRSASAGVFGTPAGGIRGTADSILGTDFSGTNSGNIVTDANTNLPAGVQYANFDGSAGAVLDNAVLDNALLNVNTGVGTGVAGPVATESFIQKLAKVPSLILDKIANPDTLANLTLQAGGQLLATLLVPPGSMPELSPEETEALAEYKAELASLKQNNQAAFDAKMEASKQYLVQAGYFSPEYFGLQAANKTATDQERKLREYRRTAGLTSFRNTGMSDAEERRAALDSGRNVQSSYDSGFQTGMSNQNRALEAGYNMIPSGDASYATALANFVDYQRDTNETLRAEQAAKRANITQFFGFVKFVNSTSGNTKKQEEELTNLTKPKDSNDGDLNLSYSSYSA